MSNKTIIGEQPMKTTINYIQAARMSGGLAWDYHPDRPWVEVGSYCKTEDGRRIVHLGDGMWSLDDD